MEEIYAEIVFELLKIAYVVILMYPIVQGSLLLLVAACDVCAWVCKALGGLVDMGLNRAQRVRPSTLGSRNDSSSSSSSSSSNNNNNNNRSTQSIDEREEKRGLNTAVDSFVISCRFVYV